jgi:hypothetical protein
MAVDISSSFLGQAPRNGLLNFPAMRKKKKGIIEIETELQ